MDRTETQLGRLMRQSLGGDAAAYRALLHELSAHLRRYFLRRLGRERAADAEDLLQETLMAVHARRATYDPDRPFEAWVHAIARYKLVDHLRRRRITVAIDEADPIFADDPQDAIAARHDVEKLLAGLPAQPATLIRKVRLEGASIAETAAQTGLSESAVKVGIHRGIQVLARRLGRREPGAP